MISIIPYVQPQVNLTQHFNNQLYSDCQAWFPKSNTTLFLHRFILIINSDFFKACLELDMVESRTGTIRMEEDEQLMTGLIKGLYTCQVEVKHQRDVVPMILLAQKYQLNTLVPLLVQHLLNNMSADYMLQCLQLDLEHNQITEVKEKIQRQFLQILKGSSYLTLSVEHWMSALSMFVNKNNDRSAFYAVQAWIEVDVENRAQYSYALNSAITKAANQRQISGASFDPMFIGKGAILTHNNKRIKKHSRQGWNCAALGTKCDSFTIRLIKNCNTLMVGMAPKTIDKNGQNFNKCGWYLECGSGCLYSQNGDCATPYFNSGINSNGTEIGVSLQNGELSFSVNGQDLGVAFRDLTGLDLYPAFNLCEPHSTFTFV